MQNKVNNLTDKEWVPFTSTLWETNYPHDPTWEERKASKTTKSPYVMRDIIKFFTHRGERVLDIFAGAGSTLLGAELCGREAVGIELYPHLCDIYKKIKSKYKVLIDEFVDADNDKANPIKSRMINDDCSWRIEALSSEYVDVVVCDPPHGVGHTHGSKESEKLRKKDFGNLPTEREFYDRMIKVGNEVHRVLRNDRYWIIIMGDRYKNNEFIPVAHTLGSELQKSGFQLKGIKIWWNKQNMRVLKPYSVGKDFTPNIVHNNIIILKKVEKCNS